ncbi:endolysin [Microbacterium phage Cen1621]|uniref:Endolysin n=1 Tax=Microbacterium phage Cen1621 TaxID=2965191 RepID=A0A9E7QAC5_9CAUD|nr:endolysin [Microbacterium phage Cen1621]
MADLKNHPGMWLRDDAAAAINALEDKYGVIRINSAGRHEWEQQALIDRWHKGGAANRPPHLYRPAEPARTSNHVKDGGIAVDVYNYRDDRAKLEEFGFKWYGTADPVHYEFQGRPAAPAPAPAADAVDWNAGSVPAQGGGFNPFGIAWSAGLQKIARLYGYRGPIDQKFGPGSMAGFAQFLRANHGYVGNNELGPVMWAAIARWLRGRWGYVGNDVPGPVMRAALSRAEAENYKAL